MVMLSTNTFIGNYFKMMLSAYTFIKDYFKRYLYQGRDS